MSAGRRTLAEGHVTHPRQQPAGVVNRSRGRRRFSQGAAFAARRDRLSSSEAGNRKQEVHSEQEEESTVGSRASPGRDAQQALSGSEILAQVALDGGASSSSTGGNETDNEGGGTSVDFDSVASGPERYAREHSSLSCAAHLFAWQWSVHGLSQGCALLFMPGKSTVLDWQLTWKVQGRGQCLFLCTFFFLFLFFCLFFFSPAGQIQSHASQAAPDLPRDGGRGAPVASLLHLPTGP